MYKQSHVSIPPHGWFHRPHLAMTPGTPSAQKATKGFLMERCSCWIDVCWDLSNYSGCIKCYLQTESIGKRICAWGLASCSRCFLLSDSLWKMQQSFTHAFSFQCHLRYNSVRAAVNNLNDGLIASTSAWQNMASCGLQSGNIWQHLATRVTACHYINYWGGSRRVLRGVLRFRTRPGTWPADIAYGLWNAWNAWKLSRGAVLELWQTEITTYFGEKTRKPKSFLCTCLRTIVRSHFHGISWHGDKVSTEALNPLPRSLVTGSHWGITGIDAGCLRLGLSDQCPGRTDRPMSHQCCDTVERNKIPLIDLYLCKPCRLARVIENKAYPKRGF